MIKNYTTTSKTNNNLKPKQRTVDFILNYSKSTQAVKKGPIHFITFQN